MAIKTRAISLAWGFCEATFFFLVPDIWLSRITLNNKKEAYINIAFATLGALLGGTLLYFLALTHFNDIRNLLDYIPGVSKTMVGQTGKQVQDLGIWSALLNGITSGVPYKTYASWSGHLEIPFMTFLLASATIRTLRFAVVTGLAHVATLLLKNRLVTSQLYWAHTICWVIFYMFYFYKFGF